MNKESINEEALFAEINRELPGAKLYSSRSESGRLYFVVATPKVDTNGVNVQGIFTHNLKTMRSTACIFDPPKKFEQVCKLLMQLFQS